jgi:hypothetical protein
VFSVVCFGLVSLKDNKLNIVNHQEQFRWFFIAIKSLKAGIVVPDIIIHLCIKISLMEIR